MNKKSIKHIRMIIATILIVSCFLHFIRTDRIVLASESVSFEMNTQSENLSDNFWKNLLTSSAITDKFFMYLNEIYGTTFDMSIYTVNGIRAECYPDYFAGFYINVDGQLIVLINDEYSSTNYRGCEWYHEFVSIVESEEFFCRFVNYSYTELIDAISNVTFGSIAAELSDAGISVVSARINDYRNTVEVIVTRQEDYEAASSILNCEIYELSVVDIDPQLCVGMYAGEGADIYSSGFSFSVACRVRRNFPGGTYTYGYLTCAHAFTGTSNVYLYTGSSVNTLVGTSNSLLQVMGGSADVAFIETNASTTLYNTVYMHTITLNAGYSSCMGSPVYKRGATTDLTHETVINSSGMVTLNGISFTDIVITGAFAAPGDSGGIVFTNPDSNSHASAIGIILGTAVTESYFTKIYNDLNALNSGPITFTIY